MPDNDYLGTAKAALADINVAIANRKEGVFKSVDTDRLLHCASISTHIAIAESLRKIAHELEQQRIYGFGMGER